MNPAVQRVLLELALQDIVDMVRASLDRNRYGDGRPSPAYQELAQALDRFDGVGGFEALNLDLWRDALGERGPAARSGAVRSGTDSRQFAGRHPGRLAPARSGRVRTAGTRGG